MSKTIVQTNIDLNAQGKQVGYLNIPYPTNRSAWGVYRIPFTLIRNGDGPTALCIAGVHGDEYEGPIALHTLTQQWKANEINGTIIIIPALNLAGVYAGTRLSPLDNKDLNRVYPGNPEGSISEQLVDYISQFLIPKADVVIDIHSGGASLEFLPCAVTHYTEDKAIWEKRLALLSAFNAPYQLILEELSDQGMLDTYVENLGKLFLTTELGGAKQVTPNTINIAKKGIIGVLQHMGILNSKKTNKTNSICLNISENNYIMAEENGIFEPIYKLGCTVKAGETIGYLHFLDHPMQQSIPIKTPQSGILFGRRPPVLTQNGDCLALVAKHK